MATDTAYSPIRTYLEQNAPAGTVFRWENEAQDPPRPAPGDEPRPWVLVEITGDVLEQESIGAGEPTDNFWREAGTLFLTVMAPSGSGSVAARQLARQLVDILRGVELVPQIQFSRFSIGIGEVADEKGQWWALPVSAAWYRDY